MRKEDQTQSTIEIEAPDDELHMMGTQDKTQRTIKIEFQDHNLERFGCAAPESYFQPQFKFHKLKTPPPSSTALGVDDDSTIDGILGFTDADVSSTPPPFPRVPGTVREKHEKYFAPKVVSIGPYHFQDPKLELFEKRKLDFAMKLLKGNRETLRRLYKKLGEPEMVKDLRRFYEENSTSLLTDECFTKMMLLDSCFILYFINFNYAKEADESSELKSNEIFFIRRDLFLLENQIPFKVLKEVMSLLQIDLLEYIKPFIDSNCLITCSSVEQRGRNKSANLDDKQHLLGAVHGEHIRTMSSTGTFDPDRYKFEDRVNFRKVSELVEVGIQFKPIKGTRSLTSIEFVKGWWRFSATVKLPPIVVSDYTKPMLLNLMAYETRNCSINDSWVTSYVCLLDSLIDDAEDVKVLRKAWVLENFLSSDNEVAELFNEIAADLVPSSFAYFEAKQKMQAHYRSTRNTLYSQLKNEYFTSPWAIFALLGALMALFLTAVQTYFTVWSA